MMIPLDLAQLVSNKYVEALESGSVDFIQSSMNALEDVRTGIHYLISFAPSLQKKPERKDHNILNNDPFAKPEPELTVLETLNNDYKLLLNKFPITPNHLLLVTKQYQLQTSPLSPKDLFTAYELLNLLDEKDKMLRHLIFYNCGPNSGSSLDHKHLQMIKIPEMFTSFQDRLCAGKDYFLPDSNTEPLQDPKTGFSHFVIPLPQDSNVIDEELLAMIYASLLQRILTLFQNWSQDRPCLEVSYNFLMTKQWMCLVPRSQPKSDELNLGFNAVSYMGMILVKWENIMEQISNLPHILDQELLNCGFPNTSGIHSSEYDY